MSINDPQYPTSVWDGLSPRRVKREDNASPEFEDWDQMTAELISSQKEVDANKVIQDAISEVSLVTDFGTPPLPGTVVYVDSAGKIKLADANGTGTRAPIGLLKVGGTDGDSLPIALPGTRLTLTTGEWDTIANETGGLTVGSKYFMDISPGVSNTTAPSTATDTVVAVGIALSTTTMLITMDFEIVV